MEHETPPFKPMTDEEWEVNKDCELKKREHKFMWDVNRPGTNWAQCKHCGVFKELVNKWGPDDQPT
jgi:hypothetical protein